MKVEQEAMGKRIRELRKQKKLTQNQLAEELNISPVYLRYIELGSRCCSIDLLLVVSEFFDVSTDYLLKGEEPRNAAKEEALKQLACLTDLIKQM